VVENFSQTFHSILRTNEKLMQNYTGGNYHHQIHFSRIYFYDMFVFKLIKN